MFSGADFELKYFSPESWYLPWYHDSKFFPTKYRFVHRSSNLSEPLLGNLTVSCDYYYYYWHRTFRSIGPNLIKVYVYRLHNHPDTHARGFFILFIGDSQPTQVAYAIWIRYYLFNNALYVYLCMCLCVCVCVYVCVSSKEICP